MAGTPFFQTCWVKDFNGLHRAVHCLQGRRHCPAVLHRWWGGVRRFWFWSCCTYMYLSYLVMIHVDFVLIFDHFDIFWSCWCWFKFLNWHLFCQGDTSSASWFGWRWERCDAQSTGLGLCTIAPSMNGGYWNILEPQVISDVFVFFVQCELAILPW